MLSTVFRSLVLISMLIVGCSKRNEPAPASAHAGGHDDHDGHDEHTDEVTLTPEAIAANGVTIEAAQSLVLRPSVSAPARVAFDADHIAHVGSPLRGRVIEVPARVGDTVAAGDVLAVIESAELGEAQSELFQKRTAFELSAPAIELARLSWDRAKTLYDRSQGISLNEVQRREAEYSGALASHKSAEAAQRAAEQRLRLFGMSVSEVESLLKTNSIQSRHGVKAPVAGVIVDRDAAVGEMIGPERDSLFTVAGLQTLWVLAEVAEADLVSISRGAPARVHFGFDVAAPIEGTVALIASQVNPATRTAQARIVVSSAAVQAHAARPGAFARAEIARNLTGAAPILAVPENAVQMAEGEPAVFVPVKDEPGTFAKRAIRVGKPVGGMVPVLSGLIDGEQFVASGSFILKAELGKGSAEHSH